MYVERKWDMSKLVDEWFYGGNQFLALMACGGKMMNESRARLFISVECSNFTAGRQ